MGANIGQLKNNCCGLEDDDKKENNMEQLVKSHNTNKQTQQDDFGCGTTGDQSSYYLGDKKNQDIDDITSDVYVNNLSDETKKCITATYLFGTIWKEYFQDSENKCEYMTQDSSDYFDILDHILIRGGCTRDVLWRLDFNDIDATVNTRELNKLHLLHLKKYHSTKETQKDSKCILWLQYAKKFENPLNLTDNFNDDKTGLKIVQSDYMLNAKFLLNILQNDTRLINHVSVAKRGRTKLRVWNILIVKDLEYGGYNLNGFDFDFLDIKHGVLAIDALQNKKDRDNIDKIHRANTIKLASKKQLSVSTTNNDEYRAMYSIRVQSKLRIFSDIVQYEAKSINLPIYPLVFVKMSKWTPLTMNSMIIHFSDVLKDKLSKYTNENNIDYDWRYKVKNPSLEINGIKDCKEKNIKTWGNNLNDVLDVLDEINPKWHILRTVKMYIKLNGICNLDKNLIEATIQSYSKWLTIDLIKNDNKYAKEIAGRFINDYAKKGKYNVRFKFFDIVKFNKINKEIINNVPNYKKYINQTIQDINDIQTKTEIKNVMKQYGYNM